MNKVKIRCTAGRLLREITLAISALVGLLICTFASAEAVTITYEGTIESVGLLPTTQFDVGDSVEVTYTVESSTPDFDPDDPTFGDYFNPISDLQIRFGTYQASATSIAGIQVGDNFGGIDYFNIVSLSTFLSNDPLQNLTGPPLEDWSAPIQFVLQLVDPTATALSSDALPLAPLDPRLFVDNGTFISLTFNNPSQGPGFNSAVVARFVPVADGPVFSKPPLDMGTSWGNYGASQTADDFTLVDDAVLRGIRWWGGYGAFPAPVVDNDFTIRFFNDNGLGNPAADPFIEFIAANVVRKTTNLVSGPGQDVFEYTATFTQEVELQAGTAFYLSITGTQTATEITGWQASAASQPGSLWQRTADGLPWAFERPEQNAAFELIGQTTQLNNPPTADAGPDQAIRAGDTVFLDGSASFDDNTPSGSLMYAWSLSLVPAGSSVVLSGADTAIPSFIADVAGTYVVELVVTDEAGLDSFPDDVLVSSDNLAPTANAGIDQLVTVGSTVFLDGTASTDPENDSLMYAWAFSAVPPGSGAILLDSATATPSFVADLVGQYDVSLAVSDSIGPGQSDSATITAVSPEQFATIEIVSAGETVSLLNPEQVTTDGNQNALLNFLSQAAVAIDQGDIDEAINKLQKALSRTDGCVLRGSPDGNGPGRDWITDCTEQQTVFDALTSALAALTP